jgi:titin
MPRRQLVLARLLVAIALVLFVAGKITPAEAVQPAPQVVLTVNSSADPGTGTCNATECTLREAIQEANRLAGADSIHFAIPGAGPHTIHPATALPRITDTLTIDGSTQPGFNGTPVIELDGSNAGQFSNGLLISAGNSTVRGLAINRFRLAGIRLDTSGGNAIVGNFIGTDVAGTAALPNRASGIHVSGVMSNTIGGTTPGMGNLVSGNSFAGIMLTGNGASGNQVLGNLVGTTLTGNADLGNGAYGIMLDGAPRNTVGGTSTGARNVVSGNALSGIHLTGSGATGNAVLGNYIGTDSMGRNAIANAQGGLTLIGAPGNIIGGSAPGASNLISGNASSGIQMVGQGASNNQVLGNFIGTDVNGTAPLGNDYDGIFIDGGAANIIGGASPEAGNLISSNENNGIELVGGTATGNQVLGNHVGTDVSGTNDLGNGTQGIFIHQGASDNRVGGTAERAGNLISGNNGSGVYIEGTETEGNAALGNIIGADGTGTTALGNSGNGVLLSDAPNNLIGGASAAESNLISGNQGAGIRIIGLAATGNQVRGNHIGTDAAGTLALGNDGSGLAIDNASGNVIGGTAQGAGNLISGNNGWGVVISGGSARDNRLLGNDIGTDLSGSSALGNNGGGVLLADAINNVIGGAEQGARNLISGNEGSGIYISGLNASGNRVEGNYIGPNRAGSAAIGNSVGVFVSNASNTTIGGEATGTRNVISGNERSGVYIFGGSSHDNRVLGNYIGTDTTGTYDLGNGTQGVFISAATNTTVGGTNGNARNVISANSGTGVYIEGSGVANNSILGNYIGTDRTGSENLGNGGSGVLIEGASQNAVGGLAPSAGNLIAFNGGDGVFVGVGTGNGIFSNSIFLNDALGIDLLPGGLTPNDEDDRDGGANLRQNFPVLISASGEGTSVTVTGTLTTTANANFRLQFFANDECDPSGYGEGQYLLNREPLTVTTDSSGVTSFVASFEATLRQGQFITATATDTANNTSEFSRCIQSSGQSSLPSLFLPLIFKQAGI